MKQEKLSKIKHLRGRIAQIGSEISKYKEQKDECHKFRKFLDFLTPQEWKVKQAAIRQKQAEERKQAYLDKRTAEIDERIRQEVAVGEILRQEV